MWFIKNSLFLIAELKTNSDIQFVLSSFLKFTSFVWLDSGLGEY